VLLEVRNQLGRVRAIAAHLGVETLEAQDWDAWVKAAQEPGLLLLLNVEAGCDGLDTGTHGFLRRTLREFLDHPSRPTARALAPAARAALLRLDSRVPRLEVEGMLRARGAHRSTAPPDADPAQEVQEVSREVAEAMLGVARFRSIPTGSRRWRGAGPAPP
jgi:hypothetical protein